LPTTTRVREREERSTTQESHIEDRQMVLAREAEQISMMQVTEADDRPTTRVREI